MDLMLKSEVNIKAMETIEMCKKNKCKSLVFQDPESNTFYFLLEVKESNKKKEN